MKKLKYLVILFSLLVCSNVYAAPVYKCEGYNNWHPETEEPDNIIEVTSFLETTDTTSTTLDIIERNSTIVGKTKFTPDQIVTARKIAKAGADYARLYNINRSEYLNYYESPNIYIYYGEVGGWYVLDDDNNATYVEDVEELNNQEIYFVNDKVKGIYLDSFTDLNLRICRDVRFSLVYQGSEIYNLYATMAANDNLLEYSNITNGETVRFKKENSTSFFINTYAITKEEDGDNVILRIETNDDVRVNGVITLYSTQYDETLDINVDENGYVISSADDLKYNIKKIKSIE